MEAANMTSKEIYNLSKDWLNQPFSDEDFKIGLGSMIHSRRKANLRFSIGARLKATFEELANNVNKGIILDLPKNLELNFYKSHLDLLNSLADKLNSIKIIVEDSEAQEFLQNSMLSLKPNVKIMVDNDTSNEISVFDDNINIKFDAKTEGANKPGQEYENFYLNMNLENQ